MGNSSCCNSAHTDSNAHLGSEFAKFLERTDLKSLSKLLKSLPPSTINSSFIKFNSLLLTPLSYSVLLGNKKCFKFLLSQNATMVSMDQNLHAYNLTAIDILFTEGYSDLLSFYLPLFIKSGEFTPPEAVEQTLSLTNSLESNLLYPATPIQKACERGHISVVLLTYKFFKNGPKLKLFDIDYQNDKTAENCALIACRRGDYAMIKVLHMNCKAKFSMTNKYGENALMICVSGYRNTNKSVYFDCARYLVEKIVICVEYMHEELLLMCECEEIKVYIEQQLQMKGISVSRSDVYEKYKAINNQLSESNEANSSYDMSSYNIRRYLNLAARSNVNTQSLIYTSLLNYN